MKVYPDPDMFCPCGMNCCADCRKEVMPPQVQKFVAHAPCDFHYERAMYSLLLGIAFHSTEKKKT